MLDVFATHENRKTEHDELVRLYRMSFAFVALVERLGMPKRGNGSAWCKAVTGFLVVLGGFPPDVPRILTPEQMEEAMEELLKQVDV